MASDLETSSKMLTIGIAGCTSSGKTTLTLLLSQIFAPFSPSQLDKEVDHKIQTQVETTLDDEKIGLSHSNSIHQDAFFIPKAFCPFVSFNSTVNDRPFMKASVMAIDENSSYYYSWSGMKNDDPVQVTGPNTDCDSAVDFGSFLRAVDDARNGKMGPGLVLEFKGEDCDPQKLAEQHACLIQEMQQKIRAFFARHTSTKQHLSVPNEAQIKQQAELVSNSWLFVEGFLLFGEDTNPADSNPDEADEELDAELAEGLDQPVKEGIERIKEDLKRMKGERLASKAALMDKFDVKLFLPTSKEVAKHRRMTRPAYMDEPLGRRLPGQMWKSEGYFEHVIWPGHEEQFGRLLNRQPGEEQVNGVFIRSVDLNVEDTVQWAVDVILGVLARK